MRAQQLREKIARFRAAEDAFGLAENDDDALDYAQDAIDEATALVRFLEEQLDAGRVGGE